MFRILTLPFAFGTLWMKDKDKTMMDLYIFYNHLSDRQKAVYDLERLIHDRLDNDYYNVDK